MRMLVLVAASVLLAGCSQTVDGDAQRPQPTGTGHSTPSTAARTSPVPANAPAAGAPVDQVIAWVEAGRPADPAAYHSAVRDGVSTDLGDEVAFTTPAGAANCITDGALACLVKLTDPPPAPADVYGQWKGNWVDFDGTSLRIGSVHGDPGRFTAGSGPELPFGQALDFGDYRCRSDPGGVVCVNYAHRSAARFSPDGIDVFGCLESVAPDPQIGAMFAC